MCSLSIKWPLLFFLMVISKERMNLRNVACWFSYTIIFSVAAGIRGKNGVG